GEVETWERCAIYYIRADQNKKRGEIDHVIARTAGAHRKYYYRRYEFGYWTPWNQIKLDIEDNPIIPVVWKDRLLLFWLRILKKGPNGPIRLPAGKPLNELTTNDLPSPADAAPYAVLCWSEYYNGKWQPAKTSDLARPTSLNPFANAVDRSRLRLGVRVEADALRVYVSDPYYIRNPHFVLGDVGLARLVEVW